MVYKILSCFLGTSFNPISQMFLHCLTPLVEVMGTLYTVSIYTASLSKTFYVNTDYF